MLFEHYLSVPAEYVPRDFLHPPLIPWAEYLLNPRRLRGSDFLMRWAQGRWSEERFCSAVRQTGRYVALPYGPSGTAPQEDIVELERYFDRLERAGLGATKRPDLLVFRADDEAAVSGIIQTLGGLEELPFVPEDNPQLAELLRHAILAVEAENSLWMVRKMPDYGTQLSPQRRLGGKPGLRKNAVVPTVILKDEDRLPLKRWQSRHRIPIHLWHAFYDAAYGISLDEAERLIRKGLIEPTEQVFQAPGGPTTRKKIFKIYYHYAYHLGSAIQEPKLIADYIADKNGHILPYVRFQGGELELSSQAMLLLERLARERLTRNP
jgi:hypothetical protein